MKQIAICLCLILLLGLLAACGGQSAVSTAPVTTEPPVETAHATAPGPGPNEWSSLSGKGKVGTVLPDFQVKTADGQGFTLSKALEDYKLVLINLWASWCPPCMTEFPFLEQAYQQYKDRVGVIALSVEPNDNLAVIRGVAADKGLSFPMGQDEDYALALTFNVTAIPTSLLVDQSRTVVWMETGAKTGVEEFRTLFDTYLGDSATAPGSAAYRITVLDQNGSPVPGCVVNFCTEESCVPVIADEQGVVEFSGEPYAYHLQILSLPEGYDYSGTDELFVRAEGDEMTLTVTKLG